MSQVTNRPAASALAGLNYAHFAPVLTDTEESYTTGPAKRFYGAITFGADQTSASDSSSVAADDNPDWYRYTPRRSTSELRTLTMGEMSLSDFSDFIGAKMNTNGELEDNPDERKPIPKYAFSIASMQADNINYRHIKYYRATIQSVAYDDIQTNGGSAQVTNVVITMLMEQPNKRPSLRSKQKDGVLSLTWLGTFTDYAPEAETEG